MGENQVFELKSHPPLKRLPSFRQGLFYIQDPSTLLAVTQLNPHPGETILDLCAAPGGKLTYLAQQMQNEGLLVAHDVSPDRLRLIQENCARLGVTWVQTIKNVSHANIRTQSARLFDRILIDAPCSNTGVMSRRVDLRWRIQPEEIDRLQKEQMHLLHAGAQLLRPGGTLVYSTCSLEPEENEEVLKEFLLQDPEFQLEAERWLLPFVEEVDGAYVARLQRKPK